jgi:hypothetical protein
MLLQATLGLALAFLFYNATPSQLIQTSFTQVAKTLQSSLLDPSLVLAALVLFFRWANGGGVEGISTDLLMAFFPQKLGEVSWKLIGTCIVSVLSGLSLGLASDWFSLSIKEIRAFAIWYLLLSCSTIIAGTALTVTTLTSSYSLANISMAVFYLTADAYFGIFIATVVEISYYEIRGFSLGVVLAFGYFGSIYQTLVFHSIADQFTSIYEGALCFTCANYLAAVVCVVALHRFKRLTKHYSQF